MKWEMADGDGSWEVEGVEKMKIIIHIDKEGQTIDAAVHDVFVESAGVVCITTPIDERELTISRLMDKVFLKSAQLEQANEKLSVDSVVLDEIIKIIEDWRECYAPDRAHITLDGISAVIEERGDWMSMKNELLFWRVVFVVSVLAIVFGIGLIGVQDVI